ncbi:MAG: hypothetical protein ACKO3M_07360 [Rubrivivax sp.]
MVSPSRRPFRCPSATPATLAAALLLAGCASRSVDIAPAPSNPAEFIAWSCERIVDEQDRVQLRAADVAYTVDERAGTNILALGLGISVFWPALLAARPVGAEGAELARLKGRYEALAVAARGKLCPVAGPELPAARAAALPVARGERLVYEDRVDARRPPVEKVLTLTALRREATELSGADGSSWRTDPAGNLVDAPPGALLWPRLLRPELDLGSITAGDLLVAGDPLLRARLRGQVLALGPQTIGGRRFDAVVVELFGDAKRGDASTRLEGAIVIDRASGLLLRLDLRSADPAFMLQRRLLRVEPAAAAPR